MPPPSPSRSQTNPQGTSHNLFSAESTDFHFYIHSQLGCTHNDGPLHHLSLILFLFLHLLNLHGTYAAPDPKPNTTLKDNQFILFPAPNQNVIVVNDEYIYFPPSPTGDSNRCLYITTRPEWQGEVTYGCTEANFCRMSHPEIHADTAVSFTDNAT